MSNGNGKVFVGGLSPVTTSTMLHEHFSQFGKVLDVSVIQNPATKKSRGFGYVEFQGGVPCKLLELEHVIDKRRCGVKLYTYAA
jgi:RNA recognition motif-containing protein